MAYEHVHRLFQTLSLESQYLETLKQILHCLNQNGKHTDIITWCCQPKNMVYNTHLSLSQGPAVDNFCGLKANQTLGRIPYKNQDLVNI